MLWLVFAAVTVLYLLLWPFSLRLDARLSPACGRAELMAASLFRLRLEGDFLQQPYLSIYRLNGRGQRFLLSRRQKEKKSFEPVIRHLRLEITLYVGTEGDGALTVEALGLLYALLETLGSACCEQVSLRPVPCFDKTICALRLSGIGRFILEQNILEYLKGKHTHAKR